MWDTWAWHALTQLCIQMDVIERSVAREMLTLFSLSSLFERMLNKYLFFKQTKQTEQRSRIRNCKRVWSIRTNNQTSLKEKQ